MRVLAKIEAFLSTELFFSEWLEPCRVPNSKPQIKKKRWPIVT